MAMLYKLFGLKKFYSFETRPKANNLQEMQRFYDTRRKNHKSGLKLVQDMIRNIH